MNNKVDYLASKLIEAKEVESAARKYRLDAEQQIIAEIGVKEEGTTTEKSDLFSVSTTGKLTRTLNVEKLISLKGRIPAPIMDMVVKVKPQLDTKNLRYIQANEPDIYQVFSEALTIKPAKPSVTVKELA